MFQRIRKLFKDKLKTKFVLLLILFPIGIALTILEMNIYRNTIIHWKIPTTIIILTGFISLPISYRLLGGKFTFSDYVWIFFYNIFAFGGFTVYTFIALNYYLPIDKRVYEKVKIIRSGHFMNPKGSLGDPYVEVMINGTDKELVFSHNVEIEKYKYVELTIKKGLFGFDIIEDKAAVTE